MAFGLGLFVLLLLLSARRGFDERVWSIEQGMSMDEVRDALGPPASTLDDINGPEPGGEGLWWLYPAEKEGTIISWIYFGFDESGLVSTIDYGVRLGMSFHDETLFSSARGRPSQ